MTVLLALVVCGAPLVWMLRDGRRHPTELGPLRSKPEPEWMKEEYR